MTDSNLHWDRKFQYVFGLKQTHSLSMYYWLLPDRLLGWRGLWSVWRGHSYILKSLTWMKQSCTLQWGCFQRKNPKLAYGSVILSRNTTLQFQNSFWNLFIYFQHYLMKRTMKKNTLLKKPQPAPLLSKPKLHTLLRFPCQNHKRHWHIL